MKKRREVEAWIFVLYHNFPISADGWIHHLSLERSDIRRIWNEENNACSQRS